MRYALRSFTPEPVSMRCKVDTLFHELLHIFLYRHPIENSTLLNERAARTNEFAIICTCWRCKRQVF